MFINGKITSMSSTPSTSSAASLSSATLPSSSNIIVRTFQIRPSDLIVKQFHIQHLINPNCLAATNLNCNNGNKTSISSFLSSTNSCSLSQNVYSSTAFTGSFNELIQLRELLAHNSSHPLVVQCM